MLRAASRSGPVHASSHPGSTEIWSGCGSALRRRMPTTPSGSCQVWFGSRVICGTSASAASHMRSGFDVGSSPRRKTKSGRRADMNAGARSSRS